MILLTDIDYFRQKQSTQPGVYDLVKRTLDESDENDSAELQRRLLTLQRIKGTEHLRQCGNFVAEVLAYDALKQDGKNPHWLPESNNGKKMPDIEYGDPSRPVEVKHLNNPHDEHEALAAGKLHGGMVDPFSYKHLEKKVNDLVNDAIQKFKAYKTNGTPDGILYLFFTKSSEAMVAELFPGATTMKDRITLMAQSVIGPEVTLIVQDINGTGL